MNSRFHCTVFSPTGSNNIMRQRCNNLTPSTPGWQKLWQIFILFQEIDFFFGKNDNFLCDLFVVVWSHVFCCCCIFDLIYIHVFSSSFFTLTILSMSWITHFWGFVCPCFLLPEHRALFQLCWGWKKKILQGLGQPVM